MSDHHFISIAMFQNHVDIASWIVFELYLEGVLIFVERLRSLRLFLERNCHLCAVYVAQKLVEALKYAQKLICKFISDVLQRGSSKIEEMLRVLNTH